MKYKNHYLSEKNDKMMCPLNREYSCNSRCAWFDHEHQDCRVIGGFWKVREGLNEVVETLYEIAGYETKND